MAFRIQIKRGSSLQAQAFMGVEGELFIDSELNRLYVHDGITQGGLRVGLSEAEILELIKAIEERAFTPELRAKLSSIEAQATKNADDAFLLNRRNHTGKQDASTLTGLGSMAFVDTRSFPFINLMPDSGRFMPRQNPLSLLVGDYTPTTFLDPWGPNRVTQVSGGKFINDNTTFGGSRGALNQDVIELLNVQGRTDKRYGVEFNINKYTMSDNPTENNYNSSNGNEAWLTTVSTHKAIFGLGDYTTFVCWIKVLKGTAFFRGSCFLDGTKVEDYRELPNAWVHVRIHKINPRGYDNAFPFLCLSVKGEVLIALPAFFHGRHDPGIHINPISGFNKNIT